MKRQTVIIVSIAMIAAIAGYGSVWLPWMLAGSRKNMIDGMQPVSLLYLALVGFGCSLAVPRRFWISGLASMALFPFIAVFGAISDPTSHNLIGIEFVMYAFMTVPALLGGALGKMIRVLFARRRC